MSDPTHRAPQHGERFYDPRLRITSGPSFKPIKREVIPAPSPGE